MESYPAELPRSEPQQNACQRLTTQQFVDSDGIFAHHRGRRAWPDASGAIVGSAQAVGGKFVVSRTEGVYDARITGPKRKFGSNPESTHLRRC